MLPLSMIGLLCMVLLHFLSVEHIMLMERFGERKGIRIGEILGLVSGWGFFLFQILVWLSPQPRFSLSIFEFSLVPISRAHYQTSLISILLGIIFLIIGVWFALNGVVEITLRVSETHRTEKIITSGVYTRVRHPQYLGGILSHLGISFLLSVWFSLLLTPIITALYFLLSLKEEKELIKEFGDVYEKYRKMVPMMIPKFKRKSKF